MNEVAVSNAGSYAPEAVDRAMDGLMELLGLNATNPFGSFIKPGMKVFIKPNWVASRWRESAPHKDTLYCVITHPQVVEAVADRVATALGDSGEIIIGDNPSIDADWQELMQFTGIKRLEGKYRVPCRIADLRPLACVDLADYGKVGRMRRQAGDEAGTVEVNLGKESLLYGMDSSLLRGVFDERADTVAAHTGEKQLYTFSKSIYGADAYISVPKLKTHQKAGATLNLKGLVGCVSDKNQLAHWRIGSPENGGDEYPDAESCKASLMAKTTHRGAHPGNDTIWRMVVDLYNAMGRNANKKAFSVIDGICAGEGQGPFAPNHKEAHVLIASESLLAADLVAARLMGLNPRKIKYLEHFISRGEISLENIRVLSDFLPDGNFFGSSSRYLDFSVIEEWKCIKI
ncbi:MAG: DUF362 domain-containing protein [Clostridiales bacterium]|jgi:uncharacterized protein (DUF362 family)|nr:DUF362 domain-containing protein [Clostridiales bacterium]